ncbi:hypothetical protein OSTOST_09952, partial [Ostertagia ostertagi]
MGHREKLGLSTRGADVMGWVRLISAEVSLVISPSCYGKMDSQQWMACAILSLVIIGCFGNSLSLLLFSRPHMRSSQQSAVTYLAYVLKWVYPVNLTMQTCSVYTMVMITFERWTAVCRPL